MRGSPGELLERIVALEQEQERCTDEAARRGVQADIAYHLALREASVSLTPEEAPATEVKEALAAARTAADELRACEGAGDFGPRFVEPARRMAAGSERAAAADRCAGGRDLRNRPGITSQFGEQALGARGSLRSTPGAPGRISNREGAPAQSPHRAQTYR